MLTIVRSSTTWRPAPCSPRYDNDNDTDNNITNTNDDNNNGNDNIHDINSNTNATTYCAKPNAT